MSVAAMAMLLQAFLLLATLHVACAGSWSKGLLIQNYCSWGCCYSELDNCCYEYIPFYRTVRFIAPISVGLFLLVAGVIVCVCWCVRGPQATKTTTVMYSAPMTRPQVFTTTTTVEDLSSIQVTPYACGPAPYPPK